MIDRPHLIRQADESGNKPNMKPTRTFESAKPMADHCIHLAESQSWSEAHPSSAATLGELFTKSRGSAPSAAFGIGTSR
jgi:hypothetical protein